MSDADRDDLARQLVHGQKRPVAWCVLDWASEATAGLVDLLVASWGPGLCYLPGVPWADATRPAVLPQPATSRILRASRIRVWWSESEAPDRERVMESLEHGCLPLQFTGSRHTQGGEARTDASRAMLIRADQTGTLPALGDEELQARLETVATALSSDSLARSVS
jgi:hypothetical protein